MAFEWDDEKNRTNTAKHGISFDIAKAVFDDPNAVSFPERNVDDEERWHTIGDAGGILILTIAHTVRDEAGEEIIRIISARRATPSERKIYGTQQ
jgi:hypothetical protein